MTGEAANDGEGETARLYGYEKPPLGQGKHHIAVTQTLKLDGQASPEPWLTIKEFNVEVTPPHPLPQDLLHSFYPPRAQRVPAEIIPHVVVHGALPWEREVKEAEGQKPTPAPVPWLALLLFQPAELWLPDQNGSSGHQPTGTRALLSKIEAIRKAFPEKHAVPADAPADEEGQFIFLSREIFRTYFEAQPIGENAPAAQPHPDLSRYKLLAHVREVLSDSAGHSLLHHNKVSIVLAHRIRMATVAGPQPMFAHLVSIESAAQIEFKHVNESGAVFPFLSLHSWAFEWDGIHKNREESIFRELLSTIHPLRLSLADEPPAPAPAGTAAAQPSSNDGTAPAPVPAAAAAAATAAAANPLSPTVQWLRQRVQDGYTIVRHRAITGEKSMALFRGPLVPEPVARLPPIRPSMYGTDLQFVDAETQMLDVSYSVAWDLGRATAARSAYFSRMLATVRRRLYHLATADLPDGMDEAAAMRTAVDPTDHVLDGLDTLFKDLDGWFTGTPALGPHRWQAPPASNTTVVPTPPPVTQLSATMTAAKLKRNLLVVGQKMVQQFSDYVAHPPPADPNNKSGSGPSFYMHALEAIAEWIVRSCLNLAAVPALYLFPDPAVLETERIMTFFIDDAWIDAMADGALSVGNVVGGTEDAARDEIRKAINVYIGGKVKKIAMARQGFVLRSSLVESFPDLKITPRNAIVSLSRHTDMLICLFDPTTSSTAATDTTFVMEINQPPHQQRFAVAEVTDGGVYLRLMLNHFCKTPPPPTTTLEPVVTGWWNQAANQTQAVSIENTQTDRAPSTIVRFASGVLVPAAPIRWAIWRCEENLKENFRALSADSESVYLAILFQDRPSKLTIPFVVVPPTDANAAKRELFPVLSAPARPPPSTAPKGTVTPHIPDLKVSCLMKAAFATPYPWRNMPVRAAGPVDIMFSIKASTGTGGADAVPDGLYICKVDFAIPVGSGADDLLAPDGVAPFPSVSMVGRSYAWICAGTYRPTKHDFLVRLRPRQSNSTVTARGVDASFQLTGATINGVPGREVTIKSWEVTITKEGDKLVTHENKDSWTLVKE